MDKGGNGHRFGVNAFSLFCDVKNVQEEEGVEVL